MGAFLLWGSRAGALKRLCASVGIHLGDAVVPKMKKGIELRPDRVVLAFVCWMGCLCASTVYATAPDTAASGEHTSPSVLKSVLKRFYINTTYLAKAYPAKASGKSYTVQGEGELSWEYYGLQFNVDLQVSSNRKDPEISIAPGNQNDFIVEQAYVKAPLLQHLTVMGGLLHNPLGYEGEDAPDRDQVSHGQIWNIINGQTHLPGNSVQGVAFTSTFGRTGFTAGFLNDLGQIHNRHSLEVMVTSRPVEGVTLNGGFLSQSSLQLNPSSAETLFDLNGAWEGKHFGAAVEYFAGDKLINSAWSGYGRFHWNRFLLAARGDWVRYLIPNVEDTTTVTLTGAFRINDKYRLALEYRINHNSNTIPVILSLPDDGSSIRLQALVSI